MARRMPVGERERPWGDEGADGPWGAEDATDAGRERFLRMVFESSPLAMIVGDDDRRCVDANDAALALLGVTRELLIGARVDDFLAPRGSMTVDERWAAFMRDGEQRGETKLRRGDGEIRHFEYDAKAHVLPGRHVTLMRDITERKRAEAAGRATRQTAEEQYRSIVETTSEGVWLIDVSGVTTFANARMEEMLGYRPGELTGRPAGELICDGAGLGDSQAEVALRHRDGHEVWVLVNSTARTAHDGAPAGTLAMVSDISARKLAEDKLRANERQLQSIIDGTPALVMVRDLEFRFLRVNRAFEDAMGVRAADVVGELDQSVLPPDALARVRMNDYRLLDGGEPVTHEETISRDGEERRFLSLKFMLPDERGRPSSICTISTDITERHAKEEELRERLAWEQRIRTSVAAGHLLVYSQPIMDVRSGEITQEELLVRMRGGRGPDDIVPPSEFLPQVERFGLIGEIDRFMTDAGIALAARGRRVQVNLSARSLCDADLIDDLMCRLHSSEADLSNLIFEITETAALESPQVAGEFSERLQAIGCSLALDDFGTGFGTLTGLRNLAVRYLKIDIGFVRGFATSPRDQRIVKGIVAIAREFDIRTIAEGVEDAATLELLREFGVDYAQGYWVGRPAPVEP